MSIALYTIVRNEQERMPALLEACSRFCDSYLICDTGSTDGTKKIVRDWLKTHDGRLVVRPWDDSFANAINASLAAARELGTTHLFHTGASEPPVLKRKPPKQLPRLGFVTTRTVLDGGHWPRPLLHAADLEAVHVGRTHTYLKTDYSLAQPVRWLETLDEAPVATPEKLERDRRLLELDHLEDPTEPRWPFYLGQTYRGLGQTDLAVKYYGLRATMGGWEEEQWYARYMIGVLTQNTHMLLRVWQSRPWRAEPLRWLANAYRSDGDEQIGDLFAAQADTIPYPPRDDTLFIEADAYAKVVA